MITELNISQSQGTAITFIYIVWFSFKHVKMEFKKMCVYWEQYLIWNIWEKNFLFTTIMDNIGFFDQRICMKVNLKMRELIKLKACTFDHVDSTWYIFLQEGVVLVL